MCELKTLLVNNEQLQKPREQQCYKAIALLVFCALVHFFAIFAELKEVHGSLKKVRFGRCEGIRILKSGKCEALESGIQSVESGIHCSAGNNSRSSDIVRPNFENVRPISHYDRT